MQNQQQSAGDCFTPSGPFAFLYHLQFRKNQWVVRRVMEEDLSDGDELRESMVSSCSLYRFILGTAFVSICLSKASVFALSVASYFSTEPRHTNVCLLATDSILVPSIYCTFNDTKPSSWSSLTTWVNTASKSSFNRLPR